MRSTLVMPLPVPWANATPTAMLIVQSSWNGVLLESRQFSPGTGPITLGDAVGHRLYLLGRPTIWVPGFLAPVSWLIPELVAVREERRGTFFMPADDLPMPDHALFQWFEDTWVCTVSPSWEIFVEQWGEECTMPEGSSMTLPFFRMYEGTRVVVEAGPTRIEAEMLRPATSA